MNAFKPDDDAFCIHLVVIGIHVCVHVYVDSSWTSLLNIRTSIISYFEMPIIRTLRSSGLCGELMQWYDFIIR